MGRHSVVEGFCMWEIGSIGLNITHPDGQQVFADPSRERAELLAHQLLGACEAYDDLENMCKQHDEYCDHMADGVPGSCARCEGT